MTRTAEPREGRRGVGGGGAPDLPGLLVIGHGSRSGPGVAQFWELVGQVRDLCTDAELSAGFIELAPPELDEAVETLLATGCPSAVAVPLVLLGAGHHKNDGPAALARGRARHPGVTLTYARELGIHPLVLAVAEDRIRQTLADLGPTDTGAGRTGSGEATGSGGQAAERSNGAAERTEGETAVVLVGRGSSDPDANADLYKVARLLSDSRGLGPVEPAFVSLAPPGIAAALERCRRLGAHRLAVVPYFLFTGVLVERIARQARDWAAAHPGHQVAVGPELGPDPRLARLVRERYEEARAGGAHMNCDCCVYRTPLPGYETRVGTPVPIQGPVRSPE